MAKAGLKSMSQYSKNFLPIFFSMFTQPDADRKDAMFKLISAYVKISEPEVWYTIRRPILSLPSSLLSPLYVFSKCINVFVPAGSTVVQDAHAKAAGGISGSRQGIFLLSCNTNVTTYKY